MQNKNSFFWYDYETSGTDPAMDCPLQFAGIRTDEDLNPIEEPINIYCKLPADHLPYPKATLVTKITPQEANSKGLIEPEFARIIYQSMCQKNTCTVGYNSLRFDDEVTRHMLFRNFYPPYDREYKKGNSRWDLIDLVRAVAALRPVGIEWPLHKQGELAGRKSFKLEDLVQANGFVNDNAHNALADVKATIKLAKLMRDKKPKMFNYFLQMRKKDEVKKLLTKQDKLVHVSSKYGSLRQYTAVIHPLGKHPQNPNEVIIIDLTKDLESILNLSVEELATILFTKKDQLPVGTPEIGIRTIKSNQCPFVAIPQVLSEADSQRLQLDFSQIDANLQLVKQNSHLYNKITQIYQSTAKNSMPKDIEQTLYTGGFLSNVDTEKIALVPSTKTEELVKQTIEFKDSRLPELLFRYLGRNYLKYLSAGDKHKWHEYRKLRLTSNLPEHKILGFNDFNELWQQQWQESQNNANEQKLLIELKNYVDKLQEELAAETL